VSVIDSYFAENIALLDPGTSRYWLAYYFSGDLCADLDVSEGLRTAADPNFFNVDLSSYPLSTNSHDAGAF
jgi:hypothetical protein